MDTRDSRRELKTASLRVFLWAYRNTEFRHMGKVSEITGRQSGLKEQRGGGNGVFMKNSDGNGVNLL